MPQFKALRVGSKGPLVLQWELFLRGIDLLNSREVDDAFTDETYKATRTFQEKFGGGQLTVDGIAGNQTLGFAMAQFGFELVAADDSYPTIPKGFKALDLASRSKVLGTITFKPAPTSGNPEGIKITNRWQADNLGSVVVPQLKGVYGAPGSGKIFFHKKAIPQLLALFAAWEQAGLLGHIVSWAGSWNPRFIRGSRSVLSNHCLPATQSVWTTEGVAEIADLKGYKGLVWSFSEGVAVPCQVSNFFKNGRAPLVRVKARGHEFDCTPNHPVMVLRKRSLPKTAWIQHPQGRGQSRAVYWTEMVLAGDLCPGDRVVALKQLPTLESPKEVNSEWAELLGLFIGDGCLHHLHGKPEYVSFSIPSEDRIRDHAKNLMTRFFGEEPKLNNKALLYYKERYWSRFLPYDKKAPEKKLPPEIWSWSAQAQCRFILGYLYSDGTISCAKGHAGYSARYAFKAASQALMKDLRLLLTSLGFRCSKMSRIPPRLRDILGVEAHSKEAYAFTATDVQGLLNPGADPLYRERVKSSSKPESGRSPCMGYESVGPDFTHHIVQSVDPVGFGDVYDIEVAQHHNFMTDGVVVSNSWASAFDINVPWNGLGQRPALVGDKGSVRELVPLAAEHGFYWGGWFPKRRDGMHFEIAKLL